MTSKTFIKKLGVVALVLVMIFAMAACSSDDSDEDLAISSVGEVAGVDVAYNTSGTDAAGELPGNVEVTLSNDEVKNPTVAWDAPADYDPTVPGTYTFSGSFNVDGLSGTVDADVTVLSEGETDLAVESASAVDATTVEVTFNKTVTAQDGLTFTLDGTAVDTADVAYNGTTVTLTVPAMSDGSHDVVVEDSEGEVGSATFTYTAPSTPDPSQAAVEDIEFFNYRHFQVKFNQEVDATSAANPDHYYFEIVEGDAEYNSMADVEYSHQLDEIDTDYGTNAWWNDGHIVASVVNGKTVVDIYLPEDARFTNIEDWDYCDDDERTLRVQRADNTFKKLIKDKEVLVSVRDVKNSEGKKTIDTYVESMRILDNDKPELLTDVTNDFEVKVTSPTVALKFNEPVFDAHDLKAAGLLNRNVKVHVNGELVACTDDNNLASVLAFDMSADNSGTYNSACTAVLDVGEAVSRSSAVFEAGETYNIRISGVTDLAGNIMVGTDIVFNVSVIDITSTPEGCVINVVEDSLVQVTDNIFRVKLVKESCGEVLGSPGWIGDIDMKIMNADGEGGDYVLGSGPGERYYNPNTGYLYFAFNAMDEIICDIITPVDCIDNPETAENKILAYDDQEYIIRDIKVMENIPEEDNHREEISQGDCCYNCDFNGRIFNNTRIYKDIFAPRILEHGNVACNGTEKENAQIKIQVEDVIPDSWDRDENYTYPVGAVRYKYQNGDINRSEAIPGGKLLPIKVSYTKNGVTHSEIISNVSLPDVTGHSGSISYNFSNQELTIDLSSYDNLTEYKHGSGRILVENANYEVEIPEGFFCDSPKDILYDWPLPSYFNGDMFRKLDVLHVADGRVWWLDDWTKDAIDIWGYGFTSDRKVLEFSVAGPCPAEEEAVPQTSKELIDYNEDSYEIVVEFTGKIDTETLLDPNNYTFDGKTLAEWNNELTEPFEIEYVEETNWLGQVTHKYAKIYVPHDTVLEDGDYFFRVEGVAHPDGGMMTPVETTLAMHDNTRPVAVTVEKIGQRQIMLTFDEPVIPRDPELRDEALAKCFEVINAGTTITVEEASVPGTLDDYANTVTLNLGQVLDESENTTVQVVATDGGILIVDTAKRRNPLNDDIVYDVEY